jgi:triosephosphate isomerase (TIM)
MRPRIVAGNWKMNTLAASARDLARAVVEGTKSIDGVTTVLCPPFPYLPAVAEALAGSKVALGAQNCHSEASGAYTGEVAAAMLRDVGCQYVILGHSERRHGMHESDASVNFKVHAALDAGLYVILCVGETLEERKANRMERVFARQVVAALAGLNPEALSRLVIAYEPVWAIGTGETATPEQAQSAHAFIRSHLAQLYGAGATPILYGGSVKADNAASLFSQPDVDGGLIGGASLKASDFLAIARAAAS